MICGVPVIAGVLLFVLTSPAPAQDVMQLDLDFKNSLTRGGPSRQEEPTLGQRSQLRDAQGRSIEGRRTSHKPLEVKR